MMPLTLSNPHQHVTMKRIQQGPKKSHKRTAVQKSDQGFGKEGIKSKDAIKLN
jgi:hypothetical protein